MRASGTVTSAEVPLGYDIPHSQVYPLLQEAASAAGLKEPFVYIFKLQDFSIHYRVNGVLSEFKQLLSTRSLLNAAVLDSLHGAGMEIVSPNFMNTRDVFGQKFSAQTLPKEISPGKIRDPENIIFDKAEKAATIEEQKASVDEIAQRIETLKEAMSKKADEHKESIASMIKRLEEKQKTLEGKISASEEEIDQEKNL